MQANQSRGATLLEFEYTRASLRALSHMLSATLSQGDSLDQIAMGVGILFDAQNQALADIEEAVRAEYRQFDQSAERPAAARPQADPRELRTAFISERASEGYDAGEIANALNLKKTTVEQVINRLVGQDDSGAGSGGDNRAVNE